MPAKSDLVSGTITLTNGSINFTGTGTSFALSNVREGDEFKQIAGQTQWEAMVATITSNTAGTLVRPWGGATGTYAYRLRFQADGQRSTAEARNLIEVLGNGNLLAEASIDGTGGNWLGYFTGAGTKGRTPLTAKARELLSKANNADILSEIGAQAAGSYQVLDPDLTAIAALATTAYGRGVLQAVGGEGLFSYMGLLQTFAANGSIRLPGGLHLQWGFSTGQGSRTFPVAFGNTCFLVIGGSASSGATDSTVVFQAAGWNLTSFTAAPRYVNATTVVPSTGETFFWIAIGVTV